MTTTPILTTTILSHTGKYPLDISKFGITGDEFGILVNRVSEVEMDNTKTLLCLTIDTSGSMVIDDKIENVKQTVKNILQTILKKGMPMMVQINAFNSVFETILTRTKITEESIIGIIEKIDRIMVDGSTHLELALKESQKGIQEHKDSFTKIHHMFLTDGYATTGEERDDVLASLVCPDYPTTFIGYGCDHNSALLIECSKRHTESSYQLVDDCRQIGILCGELLYGICYPALKKVEINVYDIDESVYLFNANTRTFSQSVELGTLISGKEYRTPAMLLDRNVACIVHTKGIQISNDEDIETSLHVMKGSPDTDVRPENLTDDIFRYAVNHLLHKTKELGLDATKEDIRELYKTIRLYAKENDRLTTTFYKLLFDDLYSAYSSDRGNMFLDARIISNLRNQSFRSSSSGKEVSYRDYNLLRTPSQCYDDESELEELDEEIHVDERNVGDENDIENYKSENVHNDMNNTQSMNEIIRDVSLSIS
jgi:hypothetical protein